MPPDCPFDPAHQFLRTSRYLRQRLIVHLQRQHEAPTTTGGARPADPLARLDQLLRHDVPGRPAAVPGFLRSEEVPAGQLQGDVLRILADGEGRSRDEGRGAVLPVRAGTVRGLVALCTLGTIALLSACGTAAAGRSVGGGVPEASPTGSGSETMPARVSPYSSPTPLPARFKGTVSDLPADLEAEMRGTTWHPGCPVAIGRLRLLTLRYWGFDRQVHEGRMV